MMLLIFIILTVLSIIVGWVASKKVGDDSESFFLNHRSLNKWLIGLSAGATANSGFIVIGAVGMGYSMGFSSILYSVAWLIGDLIFWFFFADKINHISREKGAITIPQIISGTNQKKILTIFSGIIIFILLIVYASAQFLAAGKTLGTFFELNESLAIISTLIIVLSYITWGGFRSSVWTDLLQSISMILLTAGVLFWGLYKVNGISSLYSQINIINPMLTSLTGEKDFFSLVIFVLGFAFAGFGFSMSQPQVTSRIMAGANPKEVSSAKWVYILFLHFTWIGMCLIGVISRVLLPELSDGETALPALATTFFPPVIVGAVLAGMFATILSSLDSLILASSSVISVDFLGNSSKNNRLIRSVSVLIVGIMAVILAMSISTTVFQASLFTATVLAASIGSVMTIIILNINHTQKSLIIALAIGLLTAVLWRIFGFHSIISDGLIGFIFAIIGNYFFSKLDTNQ